MKYTVVLSSEAQKDIEAIYEYIAAVLNEKEIAKNMLTLLRKNILSLNEMPGRFRLYESEPWKSRGVHIMPIKKYLVFYIVNENKKSVDILRVIYGSRNVENILT